MPVRMPSPEEIGLTPLNPAAPMASYRGGVAAQGAEAVGQSVAQAGGQIAQTGMAFQQASDMSAMAGANSQFLQKKIALDQQYANDPDYQTAPQRYAEALTDAANEAAGKIQNVQMRTQFLDSTRFLQSFGMARVAEHAHMRAVQADQGYAVQNQQSTLDTMLHTQDPSQRVALATAYDNSIDGLVAKGSLTPSDAFRMKHGLRANYAKERAVMILNTDPGLAAHLFGPNAAALPPNLTSDLGEGIIHASATYGVPADYLARTAEIESGGGKNAGPSRAGAMGPFQLMPAVAARYGVNPSDPTGSADAAAQLYRENQPILAQALGRAPTDAEMYLAHQQGAAGASALLTHPDENAVDALTPIYGNRQTALAAITGNGGSAAMTAGQFSQMWENRWQVTPGAQGQQSADGKTGDWRDWLPPDLKAEIGNRAQRLYQEQQRARDVDVQRQMAIQQKAEKLASDDAEQRVVADVMGVGKNPQITAAEIANPHGPYAALLPDALMRMIDFYKRNAATPSDQHDVATYGNGFFDFFRRVHAAQGDPNRITDPSVIYDNTGPGLPLTLAGAKQLLGDMKARNTPQGEADQTMLRQFLTNARGQITGTSEGLHIKDPKGDELYLRFLAKVLPQYDAALKAGKSASDLLDPSSKDYLGAAITSFKRTPAEWASDMLATGAPDAGAANPTPAAQPQFNLNTEAGIVAAYRSGKLSRADASAALIKGGFASPAPPPQQAAPQPQVPTNG